MTPMLLCLPLMSGTLWLAPQTAPSAPAASPKQAPTSYVPVPPSLPATFETQVVSAPTPTLSMTFGLRVVSATNQFVVTGPIRAAGPGPEGQMANFFLKSDVWSPQLEMAQLHGADRNDLAFQRLAAGGDIVVTTKERPGGLPASVVVFGAQGEGWAQQAVLDVPRALARPGFGGALSTDGTHLAVASVDLRYVPKKEEAIPNPEVFVFKRKDAGWGVDGVVTLPQPASGVRQGVWFGTSVALDSGTLAVGSPAMLPPRVHEARPASGSPFVFTFVYKNGEWKAEAEISGEEAQAGLGFGSEVALEGDLLAVRAANIINDARPSRVFAYRRTEGKWTRMGELVPAAGLNPSKMFGAKIVISKGRIIVTDSTGTASDEPPTKVPGMVLVFEERDGRWINTMRLQPKEACGNGQFGQDVAAQWPWVAVGRIKNPRLGIELGGAFLYKLGQ